ncbi:FAS1 domain-containing protein [Macroventuria anomochaeta]|uniref:FAS1 domain-containing protein n=1 Tax=Macroventuria anomochaeta TaxID=301207 RepID=A0ACB6S2G2_9PLEO|nr:FAS1 domain-containing protein [Macroventuria anomochaeta]KAF2628157.1 FAS1 domain-containing protein [Macroventuria anomochaeta]
MMLRHLLLLGTALGVTYAQTLLEALSKVPELSNFTTFYQNNEAFAAAYFGNESSYPITFLAPSNDAFTTYHAQHQVSLFDVGPDVLLQLLQYHTLVSNMNQDNFTSVGTKGITAPTMLKDSPANNRTTGASLGAKFGGAERARGQVVFIQSAGQASSPTRFKLMSRQSSDPQNAGIRSGLASTVNLQTLDANQGTWDGGSFHIVDGLLTLPTTCARTIRSAGLASLDNAFNRTRLWSALDGSKNVTCLGPSNAAFQAAGNPDTVLNATALTGALLYHTLPEVAYSDFLVDGQVFKSLQNGTVRVRVEESEGERTIWFNNAKVINANVLTHNGLVHVLDAIMVPLEQLNSTNTTASGTPSSRPSSTVTNTASPTAASSNAAAPLAKALRFDGALWTFGASLLALL